MQDRSRRVLLQWIAILTLALVLRLPNLTAGLPYINYIDEGHILHRVIYLLSSGSWIPDQYAYPSLPIYAITVAAYAYAPFHAIWHRSSFQEDLSHPPSGYYDILEPAELLVIGRLLTILVSLGTVIITGLLAQRLAGPAAGRMAAFTTAVLPALVIRSAIVSVDMYATFFVVASLYFAHRASSGARPLADSGLAGAAIGLAFVSKYPAALVNAPVVLTLLLTNRPWRTRLQMLMLAVCAAPIVALAAMPSLALRYSTVLAGMRREAAFYSGHSIGKFWDQAVWRAEWDQPLDSPELGFTYLALTGAGILVSLWDRRLARVVGIWILYGGLAIVYLSSFPFRPFRNLLPLIPLTAIVVSVLYATVRARLSRPFVVDITAVGILLALFGPALGAYAENRLHSVDSRVKAIDWLKAHTKPTDTVVFAEDLAFLPAEIARINAQTAVQRWPAAGRVDFLVAGKEESREEPPFKPDTRGEISEQYKLQTLFGDEATPPDPGFWRGNRQTVLIFENSNRLGR